MGRAHCQLHRLLAFHHLRVRVPPCLARVLVLTGTTVSVRGVFVRRAEGCRGGAVIEIYGRRGGWRCCRCLLLMPTYGVKLCAPLYSVIRATTLIPTSTLSRTMRRLPGEPAHAPRAYNGNSRNCTSAGACVGQN